MRKRHTENNTKDAILDAALKIFLAKGYEGTSVRMILEEANVVTGSFYHFFKSKEDLFEQTVERFLSLYQEQFAAIAADDTRSFEEQLDLLMDLVGRNIRLYFGALQADQLHWTVQYALHKRTLQMILPCVEALVKRLLESGIAENPLGLDIHTLSAVVLQGMEGIIHSAPLEDADDEDMTRISKNVSSYVTYILGIQTDHVSSIQSR